MILEPIKDFAQIPFILECIVTEWMGLEKVLETAGKLEMRSEHYYREAAEKLKALPEVSAELKRIGKKHAVHEEKLRDLSTE
jgi:rubrerythrin